ncbi:effector-associated constant component EACC1 [Nonomuraea fuscirosea]|uniref:effector-associated constant component EACC1 n=1 Tax=Nonomuraea fuscirosea TaxID=1291556 RepID=UPI00343C6E83
MNTLLKVLGDESGDALRELRVWLSEEPGLRGRMRLVEREPDEGALGPIPEVLQVLIGTGGIATTVTAVVAWLQTRRGEIAVKISRGDVTAELSVKGVKNADATTVGDLSRHVVKLMESAETADEST